MNAWRWTVSVLLLAIVSVPAVAEPYPAAGVTNLRASCTSRKDIPPEAMGPYCDCYVDLTQRDVIWRDFLLLDSAITTKGVAALDQEEKTIFGKILEVDFYCRQKNVR